MKKGRRKAIFCCLVLVLFGGTACVTVKQEAKPEGKTEVKMAEAVLTPAPEVSGKAASPAEAQGKGGTGSTVANVPKEKGPAVPAPQAEVRRVPTKYNVYQYMPDTSKTLGTENLLSEMSKEVAGKIFYNMQEESDKNFTGRIAVVNAVPLSDLKRETEFGRVMGEYLLTDLTDRGLKVTELRMGKEITILPQTGEFILTRNIGELADRAPELEYVVVTTFSNTRKTLIIQGRLVRLNDGMVKTSWRYSMPLNRELLGLFQPAAPPYKIAVKGIGR
ncbi:MAG: hypothetical protein KKH22_05320 [Proteobacteria bacterium]|nr:hypothetical protein [Pseudomonadota bacterium]